MIPILTSALVSGGLLATQLANHVDPETTRGDDLGDCSEKGTAISGARVRSAEKVDGPNSSQAVVEFPHVVSVLLADGEKVFGHQERDSVHSREIGLQNKIEDETWAQSLKAGPSTSKGGAERFTQGGSTMAGALRKEGTPLEDEWNVSAAFGGSGFGGRAKRRRGKKPVEEKTRKRAPAEVAIVMGAEVSRLVSVSKVMEIDDAQEFIVRAQIIMSDTAVRALQENARFDSRVAKPMRFPDELALEVAARMSGSVDPSKTSEAERNERPPLHRGPLHTPALDAATSSGSEEVVPELIYGDAGPVPTSLYQRAERCVNRLGYEWAALKWEESQVEVRALGALKEAVLGRRAEDDVMRAVNLVRDARLGLAMLATASTRLEPWHALERRGCRAGLLFGPLWVTPLLAKDAGRAAWVAQACRTEGLVGESVNRVFPQLGMGQARALAAVCRDMERVETQLEAELAKLRTAIRPWLRGTQVEPPSMTGLVLGNLGDEVERLALQADALQLQLFQQCTEILTPLQLGTLLLALMDQRMRLQRLGSFWESVAAGQDVMTGVRKLTGRLANFNA